MSSLLNRIILALLVVSGSSLAIGVFVLSPDHSATSFIVGTGVFLGWAGAILAGISFLVSTLLFTFKRYPFYWRSLYPVNFGLALSGLSFVRYVETAATITILSAAVGLVTTMTLYWFRASQWRFLPGALGVSLLALMTTKIEYAISITVALIFILYPVLERWLSKANFPSQQDK